MKSFLLIIFLSFISLKPGISCSCSTSLEFFENTYVKDAGKNCIAVLDSFSYDFAYQNLNAQTGYFTVIDTLSEMKVSIGQSITVYGQDGLNCGALISQLTVGNTYLLSLFDGFYGEIENDTFYLDGCGKFYLNLSDTEYSNWTKTELKEEINRISTNTQEIDLAAFINIFPNPANENIYIQSENLSIQNIRVYNSLGELVLKLNGLENDNQTIVTSQLHTGFYLLEINTLEGRAYKKILKN